MKKKTRRLIIYSSALIIVLLAGILMAEVLSIITHKKVDTTQGLKILKAADSADSKEIEDKMARMAEKQDSNKKVKADTAGNYKVVFEDSVIMGDSISGALTEYDYLNACSVVSKIGVELNDLNTQVEKVKEINPQVIFLSYGINDIPATDGDVKLFVKEYETLIKKLQKQVPNAKIFVNSIFPVTEQKAKEEPVYANIEEYNKALSKMCDKNQIAFVDNTALVSDGYYEDDGVHFKATFYPYWLTRMAEVASL
ncbi:GDSL-type esterase/lipase family protein [Clostridium sp. C105KSO13]|uniref:GDSL-type esterase/lipase family protein n=1 Tax=Clostridium sp. C105KSO13 TaxID=1776045 RepID=UPI0007406F88|nr:GDSL-type esterase/lipase family protein [Clostridium sp. C105KSO13]CUX45743.1 GDSL-like Lipase/Acylhydrolase [Clostridium sp. C105KSO13]